MKYEWVEKSGIVTQSYEDEKYDYFQKSSTKKTKNKWDTSHLSDSAVWDGHR